MKKHSNPEGYIRDLKPQTLGGRRDHLADGEKAAKLDQERARKRFHDWAASRVEGAKYMNVGSGAQIRQLLFAGTLNANQPCKKGKAKPPENRLEYSRVFKVLHLPVPELHYCCCHRHAAHCNTPAFFGTSMAPPD